MFTTIQNGQIVKKSFVIQKKTKISEVFLNILWDEGYILGYKNSQNRLKIFLKYVNGIPAIRSFNIISKPSKKVYYSTKQIWKIQSNQNLLIVSTSKGLKSLLNCKKANLGGESLVIIN
jgi:small subunit ribosomal protein S8